MSWYSGIRYEQILGLGLMAAATFGLFVGVSAALEPYHRSSVVFPKMPKTQYITQDTEDSLSLDTLNSLLDHYNFSIRETAAKIVCDRAINDDATLSRLLWGISRPAYDERMMSLRALAMLTDQTTMHRLNTLEGFSAFVRSLEQCLAASNDEEEGDEATIIDDIYFDDYYLRDISEKLCLMFLAQLTDKFDVDLLVRAKFVEKWLAKQRWGPPEKRSENFQAFLRHRDNRIADICRRLLDTVVGVSALEKAGLVDPPPPAFARRGQRSHQHKQLELLQLQPPPSPLDSPQHLDQHSSSINGTVDGARPSGMEAVEMATENPPSATNEDGDENAVPETAIGAAESDGTRQPRPPSQSSREEQRIRRQHREAMVLNDGTRPLRRDDIFERESE